MRQLLGEEDASFDAQEPLGSMEVSIDTRLAWRRRGRNMK
eukprot:COSAG02_NODE_6920_length_3287_cov_4.293915_2_plen_40_part_00